MVRNNLGHEGQTQPRAIFLAGDKRIKDVSRDPVRQARTIIDNFDLKWQGLARPIGTAQAEGMFEKAVQADRATFVACRLGCVLDQVQHHLKQLIRVTVGQGQRGVVILDNVHLRAKAEQSRAPRTVQHVVNVHRAQIGWGQVAELLHLLQQLHDPAAFAHNQVRQFQVIIAQVHAQQLRRPGDACQWVLDFMGEHFGHPDGGFGRRFDRVVLCHPPGKFTRRNHQHHVLRRAHKGRDLKRALQGRTFAAAHIHIIDKKGGAVLARPRQAFLKRGVYGQLVPQRRARHCLDGRVKEAFGGGVDIHNLVIRTNDNGRDRHRGPKIAHPRHAAACPSEGCKARGKSASVAAGVLAVRTARRRSAPVPQVSMNQPRCLRATRTPSTSP
mmetsp:Transcript_27838/g.51941  ORF Transcript_27838/g.51941 Transcript_27838/m.51941 type:complete len:385 (-) Transcript_27838:822-1976(-)